MLDMHGFGPLYKGVEMLLSLARLMIMPMTMSMMMLMLMIFLLDDLSQRILDELGHMLDGIEMADDLLSDWVDGFGLLWDES